jgi:uncharacterized protein
MSAVFADTFYWIAFTNIHDSAHEKAKVLTRSFRPQIIFTTEEVLIEYLNYFGGWSPTFRLKALTNVGSMRSSPMVGIAPQTPSSFLAGIELYGARLDKGYSMTDCISMQTMRAEGISDVLTNDTHFEQEGFRALFRDS